MRSKAKPITITSDMESNRSYSKLSDDTIRGNSDSDTIDAGRPGNDSALGVAEEDIVTGGN